MDKYTQEFEKMVVFCKRENIQQFGYYFPREKIVSKHGMEFYLEFIEDKLSKYDVDFNNEYIYFLGYNNL